MPTVTRPPRTAAHAERDRLIAQFKDAGLVPVLSTNGGIPDADIQIVKGPKPGEVLEVWVTARGEARLGKQPAVGFIATRERKMATR